MNCRNALCLLAALSCIGCLATPSQAQVFVVGGGPVYGSTVIVGRPVMPAPLVVTSGYMVPGYAPGYMAPGYAVPSYSVGYSSYGAYSTYRPVAPAAYVAPPIATYRTVVPAYVPVRPAVVSSRAYYPGQPVRNALRVIAP